jgi:hypothetical protein
MKADWLRDSSKAGVFHLSDDPRALAAEAAKAGLMVIYVDIHHAHDKDDFMAEASRALRFPEQAGATWESFALGLKDLSWMQAKGWVVILEKSKHFAGGHAHEFKEAISAMIEAAGHWRAQGKPFWTFVGGPDGWKSGWPEMPAG